MKEILKGKLQYKWTKKDLLLNILMTCFKKITALFCKMCVHKGFLGQFCYVIFFITAIF